jgi:spore coat protein A, manganese oxidase
VSTRRTPGRRRFLQTLAHAGLATLAGSGRAFAQQTDETSANVLLGALLEPFVDPLPVPAIVKPAPQRSGTEHYRLVMSEFTQKLHRDLPPTIVWGFNGTTPGPTIRATKDHPAVIDWVNRLPEKHRLTIDHTLDGAGTNVPEVRTTIHLHGGHVSAENDGYPETWITPGHQQRTYYPNKQPSSMLWYHDHAMGITRLNAMMGLSGLYLIKDEAEESLDLPRGEFDIPLLLQDRTLDAGGQLAYPVGPSQASPWVPEFFGTHLLINGKISPFLDVQPRLYRFRILNASNSRIFQLALDPEQPIFQIGSDGGLLREPVKREELLIAPSERLDVLIDFSGREGRRLMLINYGRAPYPNGGAPTPGYVLQFRVQHRLTEGQSPVKNIPDTLCKLERLSESTATRTRRLQLVELMTANGTMHRSLLDGKRFMDPVTEDPKNHTTEIWELVNTTQDTHPIHLHAVHFQLLDRTRFDLRRFQRNSEIITRGRPALAPPEEQGWKDTIICPPGEITRIIVPFSGEPGRFVWHCHMLEHEDNEMMRPYDLLS